MDISPPCWLPSNAACERVDKIVCVSDEVLGVVY